jgi:hypothetical protein
VVIEIDAIGFAPATVPTEDQPPLIVDADRMQSFRMTWQFLEVSLGACSTSIAAGGGVDQALSCCFQEQPDRRAEALIADAARGRRRFKVRESRRIGGPPYAPRPPAQSLKINRTWK